MKKMTTFEGEHLVNRKITDQRTATAWIGNHVIFGGEATSLTKDAGPGSQFHPATIQWRTPSGEIGFVQLYEAPMIDAVADPHGITISATGNLRIRIHAKGLDPAKITATEWDLPGLKVAVAANNQSLQEKRNQRQPRRRLHRNHRIPLGDHPSAIAKFPPAKAGAS